MWLAPKKIDFNQRKTFLYLTGFNVILSYCWRHTSWWIASIRTCLLIWLGLWMSRQKNQTKLKKQLVHKQKKSNSVNRTHSQRSSLKIQKQVFFIIPFKLCWTLGFKKRFHFTPASDIQNFIRIEKIVFSQLRQTNWSNEIYNCRKILYQQKMWIYLLQNVAFTCVRWLLFENNYCNIIFLGRIHSLGMYQNTWWITTNKKINRKHWVK